MAGYIDRYIDRYIDKKLKELSKEIQRAYGQAGKEIQYKISEFTRKHKAKNERMLKMLKEGHISQQDYKDWLSGQVFQEKQWKQKQKDITQVYVNADEKSRKLVGNISENVFVEAANHTAYNIENDFKGAVSFDLYDRKTVERLLRDNPKMLPEWKIDEPKDYVWNEKRVQNAIMQGIIQGESIDQISKRLTGELATKNARKMVLFARTAMTGAENAGRMGRLSEAKDMGINLKKKWLATLDSRTRDSHAHLDGQEQEVNSPFKSQFGDIMYPGDPTADPADVYNCRCTLVYVYPDFKQSFERAAYLPDDEKGNKRWETVGNITYDEWKNGKSLKQIKEEQKEEEQNIDIEQLRSAAEGAQNKIDFWMNMSEEQQAIFNASGLTIDDAFNMFKSDTSISEWKKASPGDATSFALSHDFSGNAIRFKKIKAKSEGWMADAGETGVINVRENGLGEDWDFIIGHESGHQLSNMFPELQSTIMANPGNVLGRYNTRLMKFDGVYGEYNPEEAFATCVSNYIRHPKSMKEKYPEAYSAIDNLFKASPSAKQFVLDTMNAYREEFNL